MNAPVSGVGPTQQPAQIVAPAIPEQRSVAQPSQAQRPSAQVMTQQAVQLFNGIFQLPPDLNYANGVTYEQVQGKVSKELFDLIANGMKTSNEVQGSDNTITADEIEGFISNVAIFMQMAQLDPNDPTELARVARLYNKNGGQYTRVNISDFQQIRGLIEQNWTTASATDPYEKAAQVVGNEAQAAQISPMLDMISRKLNRADYKDAQPEGQKSVLSAFLLASSLRIDISELYGDGSERPAPRIDLLPDDEASATPSPQPETVAENPAPAVRPERQGQQSSAAIQAEIRKEIENINELARQNDPALAPLFEKQREHVRLMGQIAVLSKDLETLLEIEGGSAKLRPGADPSEAQKVLDEFNRLRQKIDAFPGEIDAVYKGILENPDISSRAKSQARILMGDVDAVLGDESAPAHIRGSVSFGKYLHALSEAVEKDSSGRPVTGDDGEPRYNVEKKAAAETHLDRALAEFKSAFNNGAFAEGMTDEEKVSTVTILAEMLKEKKDAVELSGIISKSRPLFVQFYNGGNFGATITSTESKLQVISFLLSGETDLDIRSGLVEAGLKLAPDNPALKAEKEKIDQEKGRLAAIPQLEIPGATEDKETPVEVVVPAVQEQAPEAPEIGMPEAAPEEPKAEGAERSAQTEVLPAVEDGKPASVPAEPEAVEEGATPEQVQTDEPEDKGGWMGMVDDFLAAASTSDFSKMASITEELRGVIKQAPTAKEEILGYIEGKCEGKPQQVLGKVDMLRQALGRV